MNATEFVDCANTQATGASPHNKSACTPRPEPSASATSRTLDLDSDKHEKMYKLGRHKSGAAVTTIRNLEGTAKYCQPPEKLARTTPATDTNARTKRNSWSRPNFWRLSAAMARSGARSNASAKPNRLLVSM